MQKGLEIWPGLVCLCDLRVSDQKKKKKKSKQKTTLQKKKRKEVTVRASGSRRQEQVAELKKKWGLECEAGLGSPAAWHPKGKLSVKIGTLA